MEPEWAAVELLECIDSELNLGGNADQRHQLSSQATLSAIRVLPAPVAGDLLVTCAARGQIGVIRFYFEEGEPCTTFSGQEWAQCHSSLAFHPSWCTPTDKFRGSGDTRPIIPAPQDVESCCLLEVVRMTAILSLGYTESSIGTNYTRTPVSYTHLTLPTILLV